MVRHHLLLAATILLPVFVTAQARNNNWVFGGDLWLTFNGGVFDTLYLDHPISDRNACISDTAGNFLMVVDDSGVRNALFGMMPGGSALELGWNGENAAYLILPRPSWPDRYYVFVNQREDLKRAGWFEVDMSLDGGLGGVIGVGLSWYMDSTTAKLGATPMQDGTGYWVLQHEDGSDEFHLFRLAGSGLDPNPVISHAGQVFIPSADSTESFDFWGLMKYSVQGDRLAMIANASSADTAVVRLFHFDAQDGVVSYWATIDHHYSELSGTDTVTYLQPQRYFGGIEFDMSGDHLYSRVWDTIGFAEFNYQAALFDPDPAAIQASNINVQGFGNGQLIQDLHGSLLQLAPDGRIMLRQNRSTWSSMFFGWLDDLPADLYSLNGYWTEYTMSTPYISGFPNFCKRYIDSAPVWMSIPTHVHTSEVYVRPNPVTQEAVFVLPSTVREAVQSISWLDGMGRWVRTDSPRQRGPSIMVHRGGLAPGNYIVRVDLTDGSRFWARVACE